MLDEILTIQEVADYLKVSRSTVWRWCQQGNLAAFKAGRGWRVRRTEVERMMNEGIRQQKANKMPKSSVVDAPEAQGAVSLV